MAINIMRKFYEKYNGRILEDAGSVISEDFRQFAKDMKSALKSEAKQYGIELHSWSVGHYDVSGFFKKDDKFIYFSYSEPRHSKVDFDRSDPMMGFLYRTAKHDKDYTGGMNHFCNWLTLVGNVNSLFAQM